MIAALRSRMPPSLTGRLVMALVALVAVVGILVTVSTTLVLRHTLFAELDNEISGAAHAQGHDPGDPNTGFEPRPSSAPHGSEAADGTAGPDRDEDDEWLLVASSDGSVWHGTLRPRGPYGQVQAIPFSSATSERLSESFSARQPHPDVEGVTVDLGGNLGTYRFVALPGRSGAPPTVAGLPASGVKRTAARMLLYQLFLTAAAVALAGLAGFWVIRRTLRPLRDVAHTAHEVASLPLDTGEVGETARVPDRLTDPRTEVGQVGAALNRLLGHVERALDARHRSEQQVRQFVADASHELRTPLATIMGYAELARRSPAYDPGDALLKVEEEGVRMRALVEDLLLLARLDAGRPLAQEQVDLTKLALESVEDARVVCRDHQWLLDLPEDPVTVTGDGQRLHQVLTNLLTNARRHTPPGTTVRVGLGVLADPGAKRVVLTVADNGPGIPPDLLPEVFERFTRADSSRTRDSGGAGLGLALVHAIVTAHHGSISVDSSPGTTTLCVSIPLERPLHLAR